jgi:hypothetical protein
MASPEDESQIAADLCLDASRLSSWCRNAMVRARGVRPRALTALPTLVASIVLAMARPAHAQEWLKDRSATEGPGVRVGDFELHPGIALQGGYDSNWFLRTDKSGFINGGVVGTPEMLVTPSISIATLGTQRKEGESPAEPQSVTFRAGASGTYREFFGQLSPEQRNGSIDASANLGILPGRPWGGSINATYDRVIQPSTYGDPDLAFTHDQFTGSAELAMQPGSGTLDWHFGGQVAGTLFEDTGGQGYNNLAFGAFTRGRWKFRPKTALLYDATFGFSSYTNTAEGTGTITQLHSSDPVRTRIGINGLLTPRLSLLAMVGYGGSFFNPAGDAHVQQYDSVIANGELKFFLTAPPGDPTGVSLSQSTLALGYTRDFQSSYLSDFYGVDRGYLKFSYSFAGRAVVSLEGGVSAIEYPTLFIGPGDVPTSTHTPFTDARVDGTLFGEYRFTNSFALNGTVKYTTNISNAVLDLSTPGGPTNQLFSMQWQRFEAYLGVRLFL